MRAAIAAGHPATAYVGAEVLANGGTAADAAVAAGLASCVAETVMTGLLGGGHAIYHEAATGQIRNLDCFVAVPGLGAESGRRAELVELEVSFGTELVHYAVGIASCGVPGLPAGLGALHAEHGRLPWARLAGRRRVSTGTRSLPGDARAGDDDERRRRDLLAGRRPAAGG